MKVILGKPYPLGATCSQEGTNFALFSANAEKVELCLFDESGTREVARIPLPGKTDDIWHVFLPDTREGDLYGYRVYGPYQPENGHRFNHHKLLIDPYTRKLQGKLVNSEENLGYIRGHEEGDLSFDTRDNAHNIPKCVVTVDEHKWRNDTHPRHTLSDSIIYETHIKGLTKQLPKTLKNRRGTYSAVCNDQVMTHLQELGVSAVELLPVQTFVDDSYLTDKGLNNYWGYSTLAYFAADTRYAEKDAINEFRKMVKCFHSQNIEVILDVVYNHTSEGNEHGPTLCYRGIDNASYYRLMDNPRYYINDSGCGNTLRCSHPRVLQMIMDSLRYWVQHMHVDGFRFDLATIVARERTGYKPHGGFLDAIAQDPTLQGTKMIAEPWDCGPGGYQLGNFPPGWSEWNDQYRDVIRKFWRGDQAQVQQLSKGLNGSSEVFAWQPRGPNASVNFVTSHDGYTLNDLVSYEHKHNLANQEDNNDGHDANYSSNFGVEGTTDDPEIEANRSQRRRNILATLLFSQGVPMLLAGDEFGHSQMGNNNAYCQDNEQTWLNWDAVQGDSVHLAFVKKLVQIRKRFPVLRRAHYMQGRERSRALDVPDIQWFNQSTAAMQEADWQNAELHFLAMMLCGDAGFHPEQEGVSNAEASVLILFNAADESVEFTLPKVALSAPQWLGEINTATPQTKRIAIADSLTVEPQSLVLLSLQPETN